MATIPFAVLMIAATDAAAIAPRTFVASYGITGNTAFNCSISRPCRAFSEALSVTHPDGEVVVLDSAGYGTVTITQSVSIVAPLGVYAGVTVGAGNGITINGVRINVTLRGLQINGQGGATGISVQQADKVRIEDCTIAGMGDNGIDIRAASSTTHVSNSVVKSSHNSGVYADALNGAVTLIVDRTRLESNNWGLFVRQGAHVTVSDSVLSDNVEGVRVAVDSNAQPFDSRATVGSSTISANSIGIVVSTTVANGSAKAVVSRSILTENQMAATVSNNNLGIPTLTLSGVAGELASVTLSGDGPLLNLIGNTFAEGGLTCSGTPFVFSYANNFANWTNTGCTITNVPTL